MKDVTLNQPAEILWKAILVANRDLEQRLLKGVTLAYDPDGDTFLATIGEPHPSISKPIDEGVYLEFDPESLIITGCTVLAVRAHPLFGKRKLGDTLAWAFARLGQEDAVKLVGPDARAIRPLFQLAIAE